MPPRSPKPLAQWTDPRHVRGALGERLAARHLERQGWRLLGARFRAGGHEIDLVARRGPVVAFVEVKTRAPSRFGDGREAVGWRKRRGLTVAAAAWQARFGSPGDRYRFDVITVAAGGGILAHLEDAWRPTTS